MKGWVTWKCKINLTARSCSLVSPWARQYMTTVYLLKENVRKQWSVSELRIVGDKNKKKSEISKEKILLMNSASRITKGIIVQIRTAAKKNWEDEIQIIKIYDWFRTKEGGGGKKGQKLGCKHWMINFYIKK